MVNHRFMLPKRLILASASPRRVHLLREVGIEFETVPSDADEIENDQLTARELCQINAYRKARAVAKKFPDALILGADTVVTLDNQVFGKPADLAEAQRMLKKLQGHLHQVLTGVCFIHLRGHRQRLFAETTEVQFKRLSPKQIRDYVTKVNTLDKAGAYAIQEEGEELVDEVFGSFSNVVGLPMERVGMELRNW